MFVVALPELSPYPSDVVTGREKSSRLSRNFGLATSPRCDKIFVIKSNLSSSQFFSFARQSTVFSFVIAIFFKVEDCNLVII